VEFDAEPARQLSQSGQGRRLVSAFQPGNHGLDGANLPRDLGLGQVVLGAVGDEPLGDLAGDGRAVPLGPERRIAQVFGENLVGSQPTLGPWWVNVERPRPAARGTNDVEARKDRASST